MPDDTPSAPATESQGDPYQQSLRDRGFEPGEPVHEYERCFTREEAAQSLFASTYSAPVPVFLSADDAATRIPVILTRAEPRYCPYRVVPGSTPAGCYEQPDWYFEGWVLKSGFDPSNTITRVRIYVDNGFEGTFLWQVIPAHADPDEPIRIVSD